MSRSIELIARAVIALNGQALLVRRTGAPYTFLPGGHIEFGEPAAHALARELEEELGVSVVVGRFLAAVENGWSDATGAFHEVNLVFAVSVPSIPAHGAVASNEPHLEFLWTPIDQLDRQNLLPSLLCRLVPEWLNDRGPGWASTLEWT